MFEDYCKMQDFFANRYCKMQEISYDVFVRSWFYTVFIHFTVQCGWVNPEHGGCL